jgi:hypothetical protein
MQHIASSNPRPPFVLALDVGTSSTRAQCWAGQLMDVLGLHEQQLPATGDLCDGISGLTPRMPGAGPP